MSRITGTDAANLIEAYNSLYAPQEEVELTEEQIQENFENWVNSLIEEGHDLSEYTWEEMYEHYLDEAIGQPGSAGTVDWKDKNTGQVRSGYKSSSDGKLYKNYNDALAAKNSRMGGLAVQQGLNRTYRAGGGNAAVAQGRSPLDVMKQGSTNLQRQQQRPVTAPAPAARPATATRPITSTKPATGAQRPTTPVAAPARNGFGAPTAPIAAQGSVSSATAPAAKKSSLASGIEDLRNMRKQSQQRIIAQGGTPATPLVQSFDPFDVVLGHLIDEGYADTEESALQIMANMSEEWRESIVENRGMSHSGGKPGASGDGSKPKGITGGKTYQMPGWNDEDNKKKVKGV